MMRLKPRFTFLSPWTAALGCIGMLPVLSIMLTLPHRVHGESLMAGIPPSLSSIVVKNGLPDPPSNPPPNGQREPGGSLSGEIASCPVLSVPLTAITPPDVHGQTLSEQPTFWFYIPYSSENVKVGEFSILTRDETQEVYRQPFYLPETPGLMSIQLSADDENLLQEGLYYHWYLTLYCGEPTHGADLSSYDADVIANEVPDLTIHGWVQRVADTPERQSQIVGGASDVWYDAIAYLAEQLQKPSQGGHDIQAQWEALLNEAELNQLVDKPIVGSVVVHDAEDAR
ncbi:MAG: DUF928 domain-containing protein [Cyanobacteria bacterium P01_E01_bin.6]